MDAEALNGTPFKLISALPQGCVSHSEGSLLELGEASRRWRSGADSALAEMIQRSGEDVFAAG